MASQFAALFVFLGVWGAVGFEVVYVLVLLFAANNARLRRDLRQRLSVRARLRFFVDPAVIAEIVVLVNQFLAGLQVLEPGVRSLGYLLRD